VSPIVAEYYRDDEIQRMEDEAQMLKAVGIFERTARNLDLFTGRWETVEDKDGKPLIEYELRAKIVPPEFGTAPDFLGYVDWVATDREDGLTKVIDFKTRKSFASEEDGIFDTQLPIYQYHLDQRGIKTHASATIQISSSEPSVPRLLKPTKKVPLALSRAKNLRTDWATYSAVLDEYNLPHEDYQDVRDRVDTIKWEKLDMFIRSPKERQNMWDEFVRQALTERTRARHMSTYNCKGCEHRALCHEQVAGRGDSDLEHYGLYRKEENAEHQTR
jgi:hypothetical protein